MELKDEDIKKALECCLEPRHDCSDCLLEKEVYCTSLLHKNILDLINRQQAEIERLQKKYDRAMDNLKAVLKERAGEQNA